MNRKNVVEDLHRLKIIGDDEIDDLRKVSEKYSVALTPHLIEKIQSSSPEDAQALKRQFVPTVDELANTPIEYADPIGDEPRTQLKGLVHRYPDRCLLMPVMICPVYCRFCFRREKIDDNAHSLSSSDLDKAYQYIKAHPEIWEVVLTGGDPFILHPKMLREICQRLAEIEHIEVIRFHTRVPVVEPSRVTKNLIEAIKTDKTTYVILHSNHPSEFDEASIAACASLVDAGIPMLSQTVLLKGVNDDVRTLGKLMRLFVKHRIKPYYLHHGDRAKGTKHFRTSLEEGQDLIKSLRGHYSGLCQPTYVLDIPGGYGKVPIHPNYVNNRSSTRSSDNIAIEDYEGNIHEYCSEE